ncbi:Ig-like domain-containing protein [Methanogenium organophilum]|uniref:Ig-like domain-containing protein n=1 Tax=Methanogenium organophilum TaxID=2199 RepID=A0A9X9T8F4_METOG|nr:Ig-like domain-containing protein [Methanogenium organophilum]WAI02393.1 Ig-like domain-containing protein [Methanogenium organophilum]
MYGIRIWGVGILIICCLVCISTGAAVTPDQILITSDQDQIQAGGTGSLISVERDTSIPAIASVSFSYLNRTSDPSGTLSALIDTVAPFETRFTSESAGTAYIQVGVAFADESTAPITVVFTQDVIPADPYVYESIVHESVQAASQTPITVRMKDRYGNTITKDTDATITYSVSQYGAGFADGANSTQTITMPFDTDGDCTVSFRAPERAGPVIVSIRPSVGDSLQRLITMDVVALRSPAQITPDIVTIPNYPEANTCPADGSSYFRISYLVKDQFGNPIDNYPVEISTTLGESASIITNEDGVARFIYGPSTGMGDVTVTGTAGTAIAVSELSFTGGLASRFSVTINPNNLPSYDVDPDALIAVRVHVYNNFGTGVEGETIKAWMNTGSVSATNTLTQYPGLSATEDGEFGNHSVTVVTGEDGFATFYFRAGAFPLRSEEGFDPFSRGSGTVTAMWDNKTANSPQITWRNYPYVRVETEVSDTAIAPGDPLDVTIRIIGDGNELLYHDPIDVVLCLDRGEDMLLEEEKKDNIDRMERARRAAMYLVKNSSTDENILNPGSDRVALVTYSDISTDTDNFPNKCVDLRYINDHRTESNFLWVKGVGEDETWLEALENNGYVLEEHYPGNNRTGYTDYATIDEPFTIDNADWDGLEQALLNTMPFKAVQGGEASAPLRYSLKQSIEYLAKNERPCDTRAVVVLMQNNYLYFGDPFASGKAIYDINAALALGKGSNDYYYFDEPHPADHQNMVDYARANGVKIYTIYYHSGNSQAAEVVARDLADLTGGAFYDAENEAELTDAFKKIRDELLRDAATRTSVNLNFAGMPDEVLYTPEEMMEYIPNTTISFYNWSVNPYTPSDYLTYPYEVDQSAMWAGEDGSQPASLSFTIGNITIKQTWTSHFRLRVNESIDRALNFSLFAPGSAIQFENRDGGTISESLPETVITVIPGLTPEALLNASVQITAFDLIAQDKHTAQFNWTFTYDGAFPVTQELALKNSEEPEDVWQTAKAETVSPETEIINSSGMAFISDFTPGTYTARIKVSTEDAGYDTETLPVNISEGGEFYILLE